MRRFYVQTVNPTNPEESTGIIAEGVQWTSGAITLYQYSPFMLSTFDSLDSVFATGTVRLFFVDPELTQTNTVN